MTATTVVDSKTIDAPQFCYRHPDRETYVRCGRCDRPICTRCAMLGPVGLRCKTCGTPARDPLTHLTPFQLTFGLAVAVGAGTLGGLIGLRIGIFSIIAGFFIGGLVADALLRVTGYKRGPLMYALLGTGVLGGVLIATAIMFGPAIIDMADAGIPIEVYLNALAPNWLLYAIAALVGGVARLR